MIETTFEIVRIILVMALVCLAAALATPKGRLPLALRGVARIMRRDRPGWTDTSAAVEPVSTGRRLLSFALVLIAIGLALVRF